MIAKNRVRNILNLAILSCITTLVSCSNLGSKSQAETASKPKIVASHSIICNLVDTIAEDTVDLTCLIDGNQNPHNYSPTPSQLRTMEEAELILYGGYQLEPKIIKLIEATQTDAPKLAVYEEVVTKPIITKHEHHEHHEGHDEHEHHEGHDEHEGHKEDDEDEHHEEHDEHEGHKEDEAELVPDPHVWHDVENMIKAIELIQPILSQINPNQAEQYQQNTNALKEELTQLDNWISKQVATIPEDNRILVTTHDSFNYYVGAYSIDKYQTLQGLSSASSPTASQVKDLATQIKTTGVPTIFVEATESDRVMQNVARAAEVEIASEKLIADGLGETDSYIKMMSHNTCVIVNELQGECTLLSTK